MTEKSTKKRRSFLKWAGFSAAGVVATSTSVQASTADTKMSPSGHAQYAETEHVKKVYKLARF